MTSKQYLIHNKNYNNKYNIQTDRKSSFQSNTKY